AADQLRTATRADRTHRCLAGNLPLRSRCPGHPIEQSRLTRGQELVPLSLGEAGTAAQCALSAPKDDGLDHLPATAAGAARRSGSPRRAIRLRRAPRSPRPGSRQPASVSQRSVRQARVTRVFLNDLRWWVEMDRKRALRLLDLVDSVLCDPFA